MKSQYRPDEVAEMVKVSRRAVYRYIKDGLIPKSPGYPVRVPSQSVDALNISTECLVRPREAAARLAVSRSTIYRWFWEGKLRGVKITGGTVRILESAVNRLIEEGGDAEEI